MAITLAAAALGSIVKLNVGGEPREFYVHQHGTERTILVQRYVEGFVRISKTSNGWMGDGYIGGEADTYLNVTYAATLDQDVLAVSAADIKYQDAYPGDYHVISRNVFMLSADEYGSGGAPIAATKGDGTPQDYWTSTPHVVQVQVGSTYYYVDSSGTTQTQNAYKQDCVRPCISLPNNTIVNDDGTLTVVSLDSTALLPCIKY